MVGSLALTGCAGAVERGVCAGARVQHTSITATDNTLNALVNTIFFFSPIYGVASAVRSTVRFTSVTAPSVRLTCCFTNFGAFGTPVT